MLAVEQKADAAGFSHASMMEHAGRNLADLIDLAYSHKPDKTITALVGKGNNGSDALIALEHLAERGWKVSAILIQPRSRDDALLARVGKVVALAENAGRPDAFELLDNADIVLDGVLGTGIRLPLRVDLAEMLDLVKAHIQGVERKPIIIAVDCPSGVDCDTGAAASQTIPAHLTVCMGAMKAGLLAFPAFDLAGEIRLVGIGLPDDFQPLQVHHRIVLDADYAQLHLPPRPKDAHKGTFGKALIVGGSRHYLGAPILAGRAAFRSGAGWVEIALPQSAYEIMASSFPESTWNPLPELGGGIAPDALPQLQSRMERVSAMLIGPGIGDQPAVGEFLLGVLNMIDDIRLVLDADALRHLAAIPDWPTLLPPDTILTPHPGEMSTLTGLSVQGIQTDRIAIAEQYAELWNCAIVLKGAFTVCAAPGERTTILPIATPALARAGTGDVLAGLITGLRAQGQAAFEAASIAVWIHAQAGIAAAQKRGGDAAVLAGDLINEIGYFID